MHGRVWEAGLSSKPYTGHNNHHGKATKKRLCVPAQNIRKNRPSRIFRETAVYETRLVYPEHREGCLLFR